MLNNKEYASGETKCPKCFSENYSRVSARFGSFYKCEEEGCDFHWEDVTEITGYKEVV